MKRFKAQIIHDPMYPLTVMPRMMLYTYDYSISEAQDTFRRRFHGSGWNLEAVSEVPSSWFTRLLDFVFS